MTNSALHLQQCLHFWLTNGVSDFVGNQFDRDFFWWTDTKAWSGKTFWFYHALFLQIKSKLFMEVIWWGERVKRVVLTSARMVRHDICAAYPVSNLCPIRGLCATGVSSLQAYRSVSDLWPRPYYLAQPQPFVHPYRRPSFTEAPDLKLDSSVLVWWLLVTENSSQMMLTILRVFKNHLG